MNNSVYTNAVAKISLLAPELIFKKVNKTVDRWKQIAEEIYIPYKLKEKYHPEYDGYKKGRILFVITLSLSATHSENYSCYFAQN